MIEASGINVNTSKVIRFMMSALAYFLRNSFRGEFSIANELKAFTAESTLHGSKTAALSISAFINLAAYPPTPANIGLPIAAYSKIFEGNTFSKAG
jgi:hypothetical protein